MIGKIKIANLKLDKRFWYYYPQSITSSSSDRRDHSRWYTCKLWTGWTTKSGWETIKIYHVNLLKWYLERSNELDGKEDEKIVRVSIIERENEKRVVNDEQWLEVDNKKIKKGSSHIRLVCWLDRFNLLSSNHSAIQDCVSVCMQVCFCAGSLWLLEWAVGIFS